MVNIPPPVQQLNIQLAVIPHPTPAGPTALAWKWLSAPTQRRGDLGLDSWRAHDRLLRERRRHVVLVNVPNNCLGVGMPRLSLELCRCFDRDVRAGPGSTLGWAWVAGSLAIQTMLTSLLQGHRLGVPTFVTGQLRRGFNWSQSRCATRSIASDPRLGA